MNEDALRAHTAKGFIQLPDGSFAKLRRTAVRDRDPGEVAELERVVRNATLEQAQAENRGAKGVLVVVKSFRRRLLDEDNLAAKFFVDCLRYSGIIHGDSPATTHITVRQEKVGNKEREFVRIQIFKF